MLNTIYFCAVIDPSVALVPLHRLDFICSLYIKTVTKNENKGSVNFKETMKISHWSDTIKGSSAPLAPRKKNKT